MASKTYESVRRKHQSISIQDKVELLKKMDHGVSVRKLCDVYSIGSSTVYDIKKQREKILKFYADCDSRKQMMMRKTMKDGKSTEHDRVMMEWFRQRRRDGVDLTGSMIMDQAKLFHKELKLQHECDYSEGWLQRFKKRHGISLSKMCREKRTVNHGAAECVDEFAKLVADEHLSPEQVYDADKTALFRRCTRRKTVSTDDVKDPTGFKQYNKLTILRCSNAADEPKIIVNLSDKDFGDGAMETNLPVTQKPCKAYSAPSQDLHESSGQNTIDGSGINNGQSVAEEVEFPLTVETPDKSPSPAEDPLQPKQIQMQRKNHFTDIMEALSCDEAFVDVTLTAEGRAIRAHKLVLSAVSPYFQQVLYDNPCRHPVIIMPYHVQFDQLTHIIEYIYKGEITIAEDQLEPLLKTAKLLRVSGLATSDSAALITESSFSTAPEMNQLPTKPNIVANHQSCSSGGAVRLISTSKALVPESVSHKVSKPFYSSSVTVRSSNVSPTTPSENTSNRKKNKIANCPVVTRAVASEVVCRSAPSTFTGISDLPVNIRRPLSTESRINDSSILEGFSDIEIDIVKEEDDLTEDEGETYEFIMCESTSQQEARYPLRTHQKRSMSHSTVPKSVILPDRTNSSTPDPFICPYCEEQHLDVSKMKVHINRMHPFKPKFICGCGRVFVRPILHQVHTKLCSSSS